MATVHELPVSAQMDAQGGHVRVDQVDVSDEEIQVHCTWGTVNADGDFVERGHSMHPSPRIVGDDRRNYDAVSTDHPAPTQKKKPIDHMHGDILDFLDSNDLWPTQ